MSLEQAKAFLARVDEDQKVRASVRAAYSDELVRKARELGYDITAEDLRNAARELTDVGDELSVSELEGIAGGRMARPIFADSLR